MTRLCSFIILLLIGLPVTACQGQEAEQGNAPVDRMALENSAREAFTSYSGLIREGKYAEAATFYADDPRFVWVEDGAIKYDSQAQIKRALEGIGSSGVVQTSFGRPSMWALSDMQVMMFAKFRTTVDKGGKKEFTYSGAITVVMEDTEEGWRFISGHSSSSPEGKGF